MKPVFAITILVCLLSLLAGCEQEHIQVSDLVVSVDRNLGDGGGALPTMHVDLVGVQAGDEMERYKEHPVDAWFSTRDDLREGSTPFRKELVFGSMGGRQALNPQTISRDDPIWRTWRDRGVRYLVIFANFSAPAASGTYDPRRLILPLSSKRWHDPREIKIEVRPGAIASVPPPLPEDK